MMLDGEPTALERWRLTHIGLDRLAGDLAEDQWADVREDLRNDHAIANHTPAEFYRLASGGCPHGLPAKIAADAESYDDDPDAWLERSGVADEHFYDEDGELYCKSLVADEAGCEECETCPCMLPDERAEKQSEFWWLFSADRQRLRDHEANPHHSAIATYCRACESEEFIASVNVP